jgi:hypothetical protein
MTVEIYFSIDTPPVRGTMITETEEYITLQTTQGTLINYNKRFVFSIEFL